MSRPCFLVIDKEFPGSISTRKLVLETAKYNVLTAYSSREALELLERFPRVDGVVLNASGHEEQCMDLIGKFRSINAGLRVILTSGKDVVDCGDVDLHLDNYDPRQLLSALARMFPVESASLLRRDDELEDEYKSRTE
jgi:response regulator RpfG family c-di-GMP phosphodiesterase